MDKNKFGDYIREKRLEKDMTQKDLADQLMIDVTAVSKWERGINYPDITMIPAICRVLGVNEHELIESSNDTEYRTLCTQATRYKRLKNGVFWSFSAAYLIAVVTCFIVNLSVEHTLSWFFIVAASCLCGFTFVPTFLRFFQKYRVSIFAGTTFIGLLLVYLSCSLYTQNNWVWIATAATALGYFSVFYPIVFSRQKAYLHADRYKTVRKFFMISYAAGLFGLTWLLLFCISRYTLFDLLLAMKIAGYCFWILAGYGVVELLPVGRLIKLGIDSFVTALYFYGMNGVLNRLLESEKTDCYRVDFSDWNGCSDGNVLLLVFSSLVLTGIILIVSGIIVRRKKA